MDSTRKQPMNIDASWTQPWHGYQIAPGHWTDTIDDVQLEMLIQDMFADESDCSEASEMLEAIGIKCK
jgi:hypothetical protein